MGRLILLRHGKTLWNLDGRFTGQTDVPLTPEGEEEARMAGLKLVDFDITVIHTSLLSRAIRTAELALTTYGKTGPSLLNFAALNERHYGALQGRTHAEVIAEHGENQVKDWRRSYAARPPEGESLADTAVRVHAHFEEHIHPELKEGRDVLVAAHHNSLRVLVMRIEGISSTEIGDLQIPNGEPWVYDFKNGAISPFRQVL